jgi:hypothetical protein
VEDGVAVGAGVGVAVGAGVAVAVGAGVAVALGVGVGVVLPLDTPAPVVELCPKPEEISANVVATKTN